MKGQARVLILALIVTALMAGTSRGTTITYRQGVDGYTHDATVAYSSALDLNGNGDVLIAGRLATNQVRRSYFGFDLTGVPLDATISSVTLSLTLTNNGGGANSGTQAIELHEITAAGPINEAFLTWRRYDNGLDWATQGGDFSATVLSSSSELITTVVPQIWASTPAFVAAAQSALAGDGRLEMVLLNPAAEAGTDNSYRGWGQEESGTASERPLLTVEYTVPEPASFGLLALSGSLLILRRRGA